MAWLAVVMPPPWPSVLFFVYRSGSVFAPETGQRDRGEDEPLKGEMTLLLVMATGNTESTEKARRATEGVGADSVGLVLATR